MALFHRKSRPGTLRGGTSDDLDHLNDFVRSRAGVEAFLEPRTTVTDTTVVLVAGTGEWTRRRVADPDRAAAFARKNAIPLYEVAKVGYPRRMRSWNDAHKSGGNAT